MSEQHPAASQLPSRPNLRHLKDQARDRLAKGDAPSLAVALFQVARDYGFPSWPKLKDHVLALPFAENLKEAISSEDLSEVRRLLSKHPDLIHAPIGYGGDGPLTWAAECRGAGEPSQARLDIAEWLIENGCDIHEGGDAPLMRASLHGSRTPMMELLVRHGANVNAAWHGVYPWSSLPAKRSIQSLSTGCCGMVQIPIAAKLRDWQSKGSLILGRPLILCWEPMSATKTH